VSDAVLVAIITLVGVLVTAFLAYLSARNSRKAADHAAEINDAVNHRHADEPRLFDVVKEIRKHQQLIEQRMDVTDLAWETRIDGLTAEMRLGDRRNHDAIDRLGGHHEG
jgi:hypothetical protein